MLFFSLMRWLAKTLCQILEPFEAHESKGLPTPGIDPNHKDDCEMSPANIHKNNIHDILRFSTKF